MSTRAHVLRRDGQHTPRHDAHPAAGRRVADPGRRAVPTGRPPHAVAAPAGLAADGASTGAARPRDAAASCPAPPGDHRAGRAERAARARRHPAHPRRRRVHAGQLGKHGHHGPCARARRGDPRDPRRTRRPPATRPALHRRIARGPRPGPDRARRLRPARGRVPGRRRRDVRGSGGDRPDRAVDGVRPRTPGAPRREDALTDPSPPLPAALAIAQLPLLLWAIAAGGAAHDHGGTAADRRDRHGSRTPGLPRAVRLVATIGAFTMGAWGVLAAGQLSLDATGPSAAARSAALFALAAAGAFGATWLASDVRLRTGTAAAGGLFVVVAVGGMLRATLPADWTVPGYLACGIALLALVRGRLPNRCATASAGPPPPSRRARCCGLCRSPRSPCSARSPG